HLAVRRGGELQHPDQRLAAVGHPAQPARPGLQEVLGGPPYLVRAGPGDVRLEPAAGRVDLAGDLDRTAERRGSLGQPVRVDPQPHAYPRSTSIRTWRSSAAGRSRSGLGPPMSRTRSYPVGSRSSRSAPDSENHGTTPRASASCSGELNTGTTPAPG